MFQLFDVNTGKRYPLTGKLKDLGRVYDCDFCFPDDIRMSRRHAQLYWDGEHWAIEDHGSKNGTFVNGQPVRSQILKPGDIIEIGSTQLKYLPLEMGTRFARGRTDPFEGKIEEDRSDQVEEDVWSVVTEAAEKGQPPPPKKKKR
jgi:pSer/pThr/pTyr-binding forkhead associated (FHA) protein